MTTQPGLVDFLGQTAESQTRLVLVWIFDRVSAIRGGKGPELLSESAPRRGVASVGAASPCLLRRPTLFKEGKRGGKGKENWRSLAQRILARHSLAPPQTLQ